LTSLRGQNFTTGWLQVL